MLQMLLIAFGGATGALSRFWLANAINARIVPPVDPGAFVLPLHFGTLIVNIIGSLAIGVVYVLIVEKLFLHPEWRSVLMVGFLGAFTTFSTFSLECITYLENGHILAAGVYMLLSVFICVAAAGAGMYLGRLI